jgi:hypothetical protein
MALTTQQPIASEGVFSGTESNVATTQLSEAKALLFTSLLKTEANFITMGYGQKGVVVAYQ